MTFMHRIARWFDLNRWIARADQNQSLIELVERWEMSQKVGDDLLFLLRMVGRARCLCCDGATPGRCSCAAEVEAMFADDKELPTFFGLVMDRVNGEPAS